MLVKYASQILGEGRIPYLSVEHEWREDLRDGTSGMSYTANNWEMSMVMHDEIYTMQFDLNIVNSAVFSEKDFLKLNTH